jgi:23S rRNA pseudouridine1911/1915/1917 synthase
MRGVNEGYEYRCTVARARPGESVTSYLARSFPHSSAGEWKGRVLEGRVLVDGRTIDPGAEVRPGQTITWQRPPWPEPEAPGEFEVVHEDLHLLVVDKPAGLPTLPGGGFLSNTLLSRVRERAPEATPMHRLGRWTSGLVVFARTDRARAAVASAWRAGEVRKVYRALASGEPRRDVFEIDAPIGPVPYAPLGTVHAASEDGKPASTTVEVLERRRGAFLARVTIRTGRPHQIRIHLAAAGHPLVGDPLYGPGGVPREDAGGALPGDPGYHLHATELTLRHPGDGQERTFRSAPPDPLGRSSSGGEG